MRILNPLTLFFLSTALLTSCGRADSNEADRVLLLDTSDVDVKRIERSIPAFAGRTVNDTTIESLGLQIAIIEKTLESYVTNEYTIEGVEHIDKYPDIERQLTISRDGKVLMDTAFRKESFRDFIDPDFIALANFHGYWINAVEGERIEFFGVIGKPETDWTSAFHHYFDLRTRQFAFAEYVYEDEEVLTTTETEQQVDFELKKIKFKGLEFSTTKEAIVGSFGEGNKVATDYECGFFSNDQEGGPYYQLVYRDFNYIGSDKEKFFYLENVTFDAEGETEIEYGNTTLGGQTTREEFIEIFGSKAKEHFERDPDEKSILLFSKGSDDGAVFTFEDGKLIKFEYWTPC